MFNPLIISCGITGGGQNEGLPVTLEEQVQQSLDAYNAGACMVHIHRRNAVNTALMSTDPNEYKEVNAAIRAKCPDIIMNNTSGGSKTRLPDGSISAPSIVSVSARPEVASLDAVNLVAKAVLRPPMTASRDKDCFLTPAESGDVLAKMVEYGCKPEYMCYGFDDFLYIKEFINLGLLKVKGPHWIQLVLSAGSVFTSINHINAARCSLPDNSLFGVIAGGETHWAMLAAAIIIGAHVRVGMEDNIYLNNGEKAAGNGQLVEKIVRMAHDLGRPIASPAEAREILGLGSPREY